jgi:filamentous hemagglutinin
MPYIENTHMDVRHHALLARQLSVRIKPQERFCGMPRRGLAFLLANVMFWQPLWAQANGIVVANPDTRLGQAGNGVPIVNIATPNGSGLSHNQFHDYNVGAQGVILNNGTARTSSTELGGIIIGNPHLRNSGSAQTILNEVVGGSPSQLRGYTEVAGQSARVIVANPYGISCNGCGFINTPRVTLTTGKPMLDGNGRLERFQVGRGSVSIDGAGLNANNVDHFEIITRSAKINADIQANNLTIIAGRNDVNADSLSITARADDGSARPQLAIDSSALGGMYAGAIKLVGTETGVGVKLDGKLIASGGDIQLDANGQLSMADTSASRGAVNIKAASVDARGPVYAGTAINVQTQGDLTNQQTFAARDRISLSANGRLTNNGIIEAGVNADASRNANGDVSLNAGHLINTGTVTASRSLTATTPQGLSNQSGTLSGQNIAINAGTLDNRIKGRVLSRNALSLNAGEVLNNDGVIKSSGTVNANIGRLVNSNGGQLTATGLMTLRANEVANAGGRISGKGDIDANIDTLNQQGGEWVAEGNLKLTGNTLDNRQEGLVASLKTLTLDVAAIDNRGGTLSSQRDLHIKGARLDNSGGKVLSGNTQGMNVEQIINAGAGLIFSKGTATLVGIGLSNVGGRIVSQGKLDLIHKATLDNRQGLISSEGPLTLDLASLDNRNGKLSSVADVSLIGAYLDNSDNGSILADGNLALAVDQVINRNKGLLSGDSGLTLTGESLENSGRISTQNDMAITLSSALNNDRGHLASEGALAINAQHLSNNGGIVSSAGAMTINALGAVKNRDGKLLSDATFTLNSGGLDNQQKGILSSKDNLSITTGTLNNSQASIYSARQLNLHANAVTNTAGSLGAGTALMANVGSLDQQGGKLFSKGSLSLDLDGGALNNQDGFVNAPHLLLKNLAQINNRNGEISSEQAFDLNAQSLDNSGGQLLSNQTLTLKIDKALTSIKGKIAAAALQIRATSLDNRAGVLLSDSDLGVTVDGLLSNQDNGVIRAAHRLTLSSQDVNNQNGLINTQGVLSITHRRHLNNQQGEISSDNHFSVTGNTLDNRGGNLISLDRLSITAAAVNNANGVMQSYGALTVDAGSGAIDNHNGTIIAQTADLNLNAASLDTRGGVLSSLKGLLQTRLSGALNNGQGGKLEGSRLDLRALGGLYSDGGRITANTGDILLDAASAAIDNSNGGIYATGRVKVIGGAMTNNGGHVSGNGIELGLNGILSNRNGLIESADTLSVRAANLDNQGGRLRALGTQGTTELHIGSQFDNRNGLLETANQQLSLTTPGLLNAAGSVTHAGTGLFDVSTVNVMNAGGALVTRGDLNLNADSWTNSSVIQAGRLTMNVNNFNQTTSGQLLASDQFVGRGVNWNNDGLIASDGSLDLQLSGNYGGNGRMTSLGDTQVDASTINVNATASIAGGGDTTLGGRGGLSALNNRGRLTATNNLNVNTSVVNNYGTLAGAAGLNLTASSLLNDQGGFLFSGGNMKLRVASLSNQHSDVYSQGNIDIARDDAGNRSALVKNVSGNMESAGDFSIRADSIINRRDLFKTVAEMYSADIGVRCYECDQLPASWAELNIDPIASHLVWEQKFRVNLLQDERSRAASITAGRHLDVSGGSFLNAHSSVAASGNININVVDFENSATATGHYVSRQYVTGGQSIDQWREIVEYNRYNDANYQQDLRFWNANETESRVDTQVARYGVKGEADNWYQRFGPVLLGLYKEQYAVKFDDALYSRGIRTDAPEFIKNAVFSEKIITSDPSGFAAAIIQAAGNVTINATNRISNGVERAYSSGISGTSRNTATGATGTGTATAISFTSQLPPDLAQQQINPLTLPGFSLPTGDNGLFRLSGKKATDPMIASSGPRQIGSASAATTQRPSGTPVRHVAKLQFENDLVSVQNRELAVAARVSVDAAADDASIMFDVPRVRALPDNSVRSNPHKYLIETNPVLTDLKQFMSSDYLLQSLGYDPDLSAKRLGDGFFEQRLIQQAVVERTGQRFIDGQTTDEAMFKYLMNNAIASKDALKLSVGVTLTAQQVAALTHDIVWLEEHEVSGEKVLVPVLYLAQANNRLAPNGALVQGSDVNLIAGQDLDNAGTLRATSNLMAPAGQNLTNSGLIEAGNRLDMLAGNTIINQSGGVIAGRNVTLNALTGDVINERTVTRTGFNNQGYTQQRDYVDSAARIEAANDLTIGAGRDVLNKGSVISSGRDTEIQAGRDIGIASTEQQSSDIGRIQKSSITQFGSSLDAGRDIALSAGRDLSLIASDLDAKRNIDLAAQGDVTIASDTDESHSYYKSKKVTAQKDHVKQVASTITAGGDVAVSAGNDLTLISSRITAGDEAYLVAGNNIELLAAQDTDYSLYDKKKKGSFGSSQTQRDEVTDVKHIGGEIKTGGDLTLVSGGDQRYQGAKLNSGNDLTLDSGGSITFEAVKDLHQESHEKSKGDLAWNSASGKGNTNETLRQSTLEHQGQLVIKAANGLKIDIKQIDQKSVSEAIDAMVQADPNLAWLKEAEARGDVDWRKVQEVHDSFKYSHSGLGAGAVLVIMIVVAVLTAGAASTALGSAASATAGSGTAMAAAGTSAAGAATAAGWGNVALTAVAISAAGGAAVSTINNKGNLGAVIKDVTSSDALKGYAISGVTAGMTAGYFDDWTGTATDPVTGKITTNLSTWKGIGQFAANQGLQNATSVAMSKIMGQGGDLGDALQSTLFNTLAAASFHAVGDYVPAADGSLQKIMVHAMVGGLLAQVSGGDFRTGALAAGANEAVAADLNKLVQGNPNLLSMSSQLVGLLAASTQSGADEHSLKTGAWVAQNGTQYNFGDHLPPGLTEYGQAATTLVEYMQNEGALAEEVDQVARALAQGQGFEGVQPANEFVKAWGEFMAGQLSGLGLAAVLGKAGSWFAKGSKGTIDAGFDTANLQSKLQGYLLDATHAQNQTKATWFQQALGFDKGNWEGLASQIKFDEAKAVVTKTTQYGQTFEQKIPIIGTNGRTIDVPFVFLKDGSGTVRLVTGVPAKK